MEVIEIRRKAIYAAIDITEKELSVSNRLLLSDESWAIYLNASGARSDRLRELRMSLYEKRQEVFEFQRQLYDLL